FGERDVRGLPPAELCRLGIARTFQIVRPFPNLTVLENVAIGCIYRQEGARSRRQAEAEARTVIETVGLQARPELPARNLTLVGRKRLELARALATRPRLLLLAAILSGHYTYEVLEPID